jgi:hypothetical protein
MDKQAASQFIQHYSSVPEEELVRLHASKSALVEEAQFALDEVVARRGVNVEAIRASNEAEDQAAVEAEKVVHERRRNRDATIYKWFLWVFGPIIVIVTLLRPERAWETLVSTVVQVLCIGAVAWLVVRFRRRK